MKLAPLPLALAITATSMPVLAQSVSTLEEIVVTAQKREQSLQDVPIAVTVLGADFIKQTGATTLSDIAKSTPGLSLTDTQSEDTAIYLRGIGSGDFGYSSDESIPVYLDGVYLGSGSALIGDLLDITQIEVLKGPQGSLFGRNAVGGAVSVTTAKPSNELEGSASIDIGNYNLRTAKGVLNLPVIEDKLLARVAISKRDRDGWQTNSATGVKDGYAQDRWSARAKLLWLINDDLELEISSDWLQENDHSGYYHVLGGDFAPLLSPETSNLSGQTANNGNGFLAIDPNTGSLIFDGPQGQGVDYGLKRRVRGNAAKLQWHINDALSLTSVSSYRQLSSAISEDNDGSEFHVLNVRAFEDNEEYSQELRLNGVQGDLDWFVGLSAYKSDIDGRVTDSFGALIIGETFDEVAKVKAKTESYALFGDAIWSITEKTKLTVGFRYSYDSKSQDIRNPNPVGLLFAGSAQFLDENGNPDPSLASSHKNWSNISPRFVLDHYLNDDTLVYAGVSQGYKSGGFNSFPTVDTSGNTVIPGTSFPAVPFGSTEPFEEERITNYEAGIKSTLLNQRLRFNASVFYYDFTDLQFLIGQGVVTRASNAGKANGKGVDIETTYLLSDDLTISTNISWLDTEYGSDVVEFGNKLIVKKGQDLTLAPKLSGNINLDYATSFEDIGELRINLNYSYTGDRRHGNKTDNPIYREKSSALLNGRVALTPEDAQWEVALWGKNLSNETSIETFGGVTDDFGFISARRNEPRTYGINLNFYY